MAKLMLFVIVSAVALIATAAAFQQKQLRCASTNSYASGLTDFQLSCLDNIPRMGSDKFSPLWIERTQNPARMLDFIEHCTCTLLSMTMVWETMLTHEIEILYAVSRDFVDEFSNALETAVGKIEKKNVKRVAEGKEIQPFLTVRRDNKMFAGDDGDSLYHYYVLKYVVDSAETAKEKAKFFERIITRSSKIYFDLKHLETSYNMEEKFPMDHRFTLLMSATCKQLSNWFGPYLEAIGMMKAGFNNEMWTYRVASHDETLFKLVISSMLCKVINQQMAEHQNALRAASG